MTTQDTYKTIPSTHDVFREYRATTGSQKYMQNDLFIATMTREDIAKITIQLVQRQSECRCISDGDGFRRLLNQIIEQRAWGNISHLVTH